MSVSSSSTQDRGLSQSPSPHTPVSQRTTSSSSAPFRPFQRDGARPSDAETRGVLPLPVSPSYLAPLRDGTHDLVFHSPSPVFADIAPPSDPSTVRSPYTTPQKDHNFYPPYRPFNPLCLPFYRTWGHRRRPTTPSGSLSFLSYKTLGF